MSLRGCGKSLIAMSQEWQIVKFPPSPPLIFRAHAFQTSKRFVFAKSLYTKVV